MGGYNLGKEIMEAPKYRHSQDKSQRQVGPPLPVSESPLHAWHTVWGWNRHVPREEPGQCGRKRSRKDFWRKCHWARPSRLGKFECVELEGEGQGSPEWRHNREQRGQSQRYDQSSQCSVEKMCRNWNRRTNWGPLCGQPMPTWPGGWILAPSLVPKKISVHISCTYGTMTFTTWMVKIINIW